METVLEKFLEETVRPEEKPGDFLEVMNGPDDGKTFPITKTPMIIGRLESNDVPLVDGPVASRSHARLTQEQGVYYIEDLNSRNGVIVDGNQIHSTQALRNGSMILIGETLLCFRCGVEHQT
jgi:pSer/pThr/pTyr-binding forkhead associated (FHA) protein